MTIRIALVAGEPSGDLLASLLIRALKEAHPDIEFYGIGGPKMAAQGCKIVQPFDPLAVHGFVDALKRLKKLSTIRKKFLNLVLKNRPDMLIGVDAPDFNLWLEKKAKRSGITTVHFVSPSIWAWRGGRIHTIGQSISKMLCLFPFEPELYHKHNIPAVFVGHPMADEIPLEVDQASMRATHKLPAEGLVFALLPGSRNSEIINITPLLIDAAEILQQKYPEARFVLPAATRFAKDFVDRYLARLGSSLEIRVMFSHAGRAMAVSDCVLVASGTATLEAALYKKPMVITYKVGKFQYYLYRYMTYLPWVGLPNILCHESLVPELLQDKANAQDIAAAAITLVEDKARCLALHQRFTELHVQLKNNAADTAARDILAMLGVA